MRASSNVSTCVRVFRPHRKKFRATRIPQQFPTLLYFAKEKDKDEEPRLARAGNRLKFRAGTFLFADVCVCVCVCVCEIARPRRDLISWFSRERKSRPGRERDEERSKASKQVHTRNRG